MKTYFILSLFFSVGLISCSNQTEKNAVKTEATTVATSDSSSSNFIITNPQDTAIISDGESIQRYKNGVVKMKGLMKDGKREGLWKSWYEDGTPWSETTFSAGIKNGPTTTWFPNGKKRYQGFFSNDTESGKWKFWDENGKEQLVKDFETK